MVYGSQQLLYQVELLTGGYEEIGAPASALNAGQRLSVLRSHVSRWKNPNCLNGQPELFIPLQAEFPSFCVLQGGYLFLGRALRRCESAWSLMTMVSRQTARSGRDSKHRRPPPSLQGRGGPGDLLGRVLVLTTTRLSGADV